MPVPSWWLAGLFLAVVGPWLLRVVVRQATNQTVRTTRDLLAAAGQGRDEDAP
jgi:hypothetical protein